MIDKPSLKNLTSTKFKGPQREQNEVNIYFFFRIFFALYFFLTFLLLQFLKSLGSPHLESFNYLLEEGLNQMVEHLVPVEFEHNNHRIKLWFSVTCFY